jgi:putative hemolysin
MAQTVADVTACQVLRYACFQGGVGQDIDMFDPLSEHVMIERDGQLICTLRLRVMPDGADLGQTYTGQFYDIGPITGPTLEVGRFCLRDDPFSYDVLRWAWVAITRSVDDHAIKHVFGCASFPGTDPARYAKGFAHLQDTYVGTLKVTPKAIDYKSLFDVRCPDAAALCGLDQIPPLLRSYLQMGGYVSDCLVIDRTLGTLHVFAGLQIDAIPPARVKTLRRLVAQTVGLHIPA